MKAWKLTYIKTGNPIILCDENQFKINTYYGNVYSPEKCGVTVEQGQFLTDQELEDIKQQVAREINEKNSK